MIFLSKEESISEIYSTKDSIYFAKEDVAEKVKKFILEYTKRIIFF